jgi:hypothetical protein
VEWTTNMLANAPPPGGPEQPQGGSDQPTP